MAYLSVGFSRFMTSGGEDRTGIMLSLSLIILLFLYAGVFPSFGCFGKLWLFHCGTLWAFHYDNNYNWFMSSDLFTLCLVCSITSSMLSGLDTRSLGLNTLGTTYSSALSQSVEAGCTSTVKCDLL